MVGFFMLYQKHILTLRLGLIQVEAGTVVYGRSLQGPVDVDGYRTADDDVFLCADGDGWVLYSIVKLYFPHLLLAMGIPSQESVRLSAIISILQLSLNHKCPEKPCFPNWWNAF
jgi:hypothetical protein